MSKRDNHDEDVKKITRILPEGCDVEGAVRFLLDKRIISHTGPRHAEVYYRWKEEATKTGCPGRASIGIAYQSGISDRQVYRIRKRFDD